ncbi:hypothetical protein GEMRC1_004186 [Eukaryota sp. GEM-RC1]
MSHAPSSPFKPVVTRYAPPYQHNPPPTLNGGTSYLIQSGHSLPPAVQLVPNLPTVGTSHSLHIQSAPCSVCKHPSKYEAKIAEQMRDAHVRLMLKYSAV